MKGRKTDENMQFSTTDSIYELFEINTPWYSHCISMVSDCTIIGYKDKFSGKWNTTDYLLETRPETMKFEYELDGDKCKIISIRDVMRLLGKDELFLALL